MLHKLNSFGTLLISKQLIHSEKKIHANVDGKAVVVSESLVRRYLYLNDEDGTACLTTNEIFENLALMGYEPASGKLTFYKGLFSSQWKYLVHTILHFLSSKSTSWDQFSINLASAIICLAKGQKFNFSKLIFDGKGFSGRVTPLFQNMLVPPVVVGEGSEQPPEPQPTPSSAPPEFQSQITTAAASQPPKDPNTYRRTKKGQKTKVPQSGGSPNKFGDEAINEEMLDRGHTLRSGEDSMEHQIELTDNVPNTPHDSPLLGVNKPRSDEGSLELNELMDLVTKLSHRVFDLKKIKIAQAKEIASLKRRVTKLVPKTVSTVAPRTPPTTITVLDKGCYYGYVVSYLIEDKGRERQGRASKGC
ncbi:hypothetical protein Tco_1507843 [Tanacetum coccineum]